MLQERIEKMEKELAELKVLAKKEEEFKVGDWVLILDYSKEVCSEQTHCNGHVGKIDSINGSDAKVLVEGNGLANYGLFRKTPRFRKATPSEIEYHLIKEAEKKGFVKGARVIYKKHPEAEEIEYLFIQCTTHRLAKCPPKDYSKCEVAAQLKNNGWVFLSECELLPSCPQITINGYKAEFKDWGLDFNNGCAKIDKDVFLILNEALSRPINLTGSKVVTSVTIGAGRFTVKEIEEIAKYYETK